MQQFSLNSSELVSDFHAQFAFESVYFFLEASFKARRAVTNEDVARRPFTEWIVRPRGPSCWAA
jgi:hypothetical protein